MSDSVETIQAEKDLASVQLGGPQLAKAREIASTMGVSVATVTRWSLDFFDLSLFLTRRQLELTGQSIQQSNEVPA